MIVPANPVRGRVIVTLLVGAIVTMGVLMLSKPKRGTIRWHQQAYLQLRYPKPPLKWHVLRAWAGVRGRGVYSGEDDFDVSDRLSQQAEHLRALQELGYLDRRLITFTNMSNPRSWELSALASRRMRNRHIWRVSSEGSNALLVIYAKKDSQLWDEMIRNFEQGKGQ